MNRRELERTGQGLAVCRQKGLISPDRDDVKELIATLVIVERQYLSGYTTHSARSILKGYDEAIKSGKILVLDLNNKVEQLVKKFDK